MPPDPPALTLRRAALPYPAGVDPLEAKEINMSNTQAPVYRLGVDVGGTFTDLLLINETTGEIGRASGTENV